jgi:hypothetical protein
MASLISALDNFTPSQIGENGSTEYTWSNSVRERILQLSFQLTRTKDRNAVDKLAEVTQQILKDLSNNYKAGVLCKETYMEYMSIMYRMVGHTRDIIDGKGEYALSYALLEVWFQEHPALAQFALEQFLVSGNEEVHPYGSWKDVKQLYGYLEQGKNMVLADHGVQLMLKQLKADVSEPKPSLAAKWVPREGSKYGDLFEIMALRYFNVYIVTAKTEETKKRAILKAKMDFRRLISSLNKRLDTVQIKQCGLNWAAIEPANQTSITMHKQKKAFLNLTKSGTQRSNLEDRIVCANKFKEYAEKAVTGEVEIKGKRVGLNDFTKEAITLIGKHNSKSEIAILNAQWLDNSKQTGALGKMIAMVDVSGSMSGDPMNAAIALGIRVAEKSILGKRVMTFSAEPQWLNLTGVDTFCDMVQVVHSAPWGMNTNFAAALRMILDSIIQNKLTPEDVEDMVLAIFSDMQMDEANTSSRPLMRDIEQEYAKAGQSLWNKPFKPPHILFWNLRSTQGFPTLSTQKGASMMSGFSPALLNLFCDEGLKALQTCTPWSLFVKGLNNERYNVLDQQIRNYL